MAEIRFSDVYKTFGTKAAVQGVTLTCPDRRYVCLLGPSGCGKTTMLRLLAGLESPERGDILVGGERFNDLDPAARNVGLAFQNYALYPHLTVRDNLAFPLRAPRRRGQYSGAEIARRVDEVASLLRIHELLDKRPGALSGGQQQRVSLGRALVRHPSALLLDEPIAHLDARLRYEMRAELKTLHQRLQTTTIHVTHDQQEALALADLIVVMRKGRIEQVGASLEVFMRPATDFVAGFVGDPPYSLIDAGIAHAGGSRCAVVAGRTLPLPDAMAPALTAGTAVRLGLRPRHIEIVESGDRDGIPGIVYSHEMVGRELQLLIQVDGGMLRYRTREQMSFRTGEPLRVRLDLDGARLFDAATGLALAAASAAAAPEDDPAVTHGLGAPGRVTDRNR